MVKQFMEDDPGYLDWVKNNNGGYVVNYMGGPTPFHPVLHKAECRTITGTPSNGTRWTGTWLKACSQDLSELRGWLDGQGAADVRACRVCNPANDAVSTRPTY